METESTTGTRLTTDAPLLVRTRSTWAIDPAHSLVEFAVKHMMFTTVRGRFTDISGTITCADESDPTRSTVEATIAAASINTGDENRDAHLRSADFLDAVRFPAITFKSKQITRASEDQLRMMGDLTIRGVTKEVVLETTYNGRGKNPYGKEVAGFTAEATLNRKDFSLTWNVALESGGLLVGDKLTVLIEIQAVKQS
jgi:polyisoprenoid-binding protein YceI